VTLRLFEGYGIELEYMLVEREGLGVLPRADEILRDGQGVVSDLERGPIAWSNELVLHVIELKTNGPAAGFDGLADAFQADVDEVNRRLAGIGGRLLPTAMHPWMDPERETRLWPHEHGAVYGAFDRIFSCRGHGWSNLQSAHLNLPFGDDDEFGRLHAAIRLVLPLVPALAASSPFVEGHATGALDNRLRYYRTNCASIPRVTGDVVPEPAFTPDDYQREILERIYEDLAPHDPEGVLRHEWVNARGAIARFDRSAIEIRLVDVQECPRMDVAVMAALAALVKRLVERDDPRQRAWAAQRLASILARTVHHAEAAVLTDLEYLAVLGLPSRRPLSAGEGWAHLASEMRPHGHEDLATILEQGTLARRILRAAGEEPSRGRLREVYRALADALAAGRAFVP
jgi:gamma-glutamyl:cysteine ligase YbdK (ATP-grasp superfamily)